MAEPMIVPLSGRTLARALAGMYGPGVGSLGVDARVVASELGVSVSSVRRWCAGASPDRPARIPKTRLEVVLAAHRPRELVVKQQRLDRGNALGALSRIDVRKPKSVLPAWHKKRWLEPHCVALVTYPEVGLGGIVVSRISTGNRLLATAAGREGVIGDRLVFTNQFAGRVVAMDVLEQCSRWRCVPSSATLSAAVAQNRLWLDVAVPDLVAVAKSSGMDEYLMPPGDFGSAAIG